MPLYMQSVAATMLMLALPAGIAREIHVSPTGDDARSGTAAAPLRTLAAAQAAARGSAGREPVSVIVADGVYYLPNTLVFTPADSGQKDAPIIYQAAREGGAVISGGLRLSLKWESWRDGIFKAATPEGLAIDQLFINGQRQRMARYPNFDAAKTTSAYQGFAADAFSKERAMRWADPAGGFIHAMHVGRWGGYHYRITGKKPDGSIEYEGGWQNNRQMGMHKEFRMVENILEELDAPGEWFHDAKTNTLYFMPGIVWPPLAEAATQGPLDQGRALQEAVVEVVRLRHLVEFQGSQSTPVRHITLQGFVFRHAARTFMDTREPLLRSDWAIYRGGAMVLTGTEDVAVRDCEFDQVGGNAVFVNHYNRRALIKGCHIHDAGASGVCFVGDPAAVRNPLFEYGQTQDLSKIDRTPGPQTDNYPADSAVEDCLIHGIGRVERQPAGVQISMAQNIAVRDTSIYDCARAGINISEGTWGGHLVERCDVFETVLETHDHGSFNSWGRDRFWSSNHRGVSQPAVNQDPKLPYLDAVKPTVLRDSRWRCDHGWDIDLDDGSSHYEIYNNLLLHGGLKFREGFGRRAYNNIIVNNGFHPHVWFDRCDSTFTGNIAMKSHADIGMPAGWTAGIDRNFYTSASVLASARAKGGDAHSASGDPMFVDPAAGDFRVKDGSPALALGFKNFPMDQFGVKKPSLKSISQKPVIPPVQLDTGAGGKAAVDAPTCWLGALLHGLQGEEFSAFGTAKEDGGVQLVNVPAGSAAEKAGLLKNDLVQSLNGRKVVTVSDLLAALAAAADGPLKVKVVRNQKAREIELRSQPHLVLEAAADPGSFQRFVPKDSTARVSARGATSNDPVELLIDGRLARGYGPVFANGVADGAYKMDLGAVRKISAATSWSFNQNGNRANQRVTLYGSRSGTDPGWNLSDAARFTPLGSLDTTRADLKTREFVAASLRAPAGGSLGSYRWLVWAVSPVTPLGENTAFQELAVETRE